MAMRLNLTKIRFCIMFCISKKNKKTTRLSPVYNKFKLKFKFKILLSLNNTAIRTFLVI